MAEKKSKDTQENKKHELIGKQFDVLDHGFVRLVDYMGDDGAIVQAARVSYGEGTTKKSRDRELIRYLLGHYHTSPFEMVEFKFHVKLPIFVARQWIRHRTANVNEYSGRYSVMKQEFYRPEPDQLRTQSKTNHQARSTEELPDDQKSAFAEHQEQTQGHLYEEYNKFIDAGLARELARINLPLSMYTEWYWKIDLHNLLHFLRLRIDSHAQYEIRVYGEVIGEMVKAICPISWEAFEDYRLNALGFSAVELKIISEAVGDFAPDKEALVKAGLSKFEANEFLDKLAQIRKE